MSPLTRKILEQLIVRYERPRRQNVARVRLDEQQYLAYFSQTDVTARETTHQELKQLSQQGIVTLHWKKWEVGNWLTAVDVVNAEALYALLKRAPRSNQVADLFERLGQQIPRVEWHERFLAWTVEQLNQNHSPAPLLLQDAAFNRDLLSALDAIAQLGAPTLERALSVRLYADSKRFTTLRGSVLRVLRRFDPNAVLYAGDDAALLRAHYIERAPEYVPMAGAMRLVVNEQPLDLTPFVMSVALPADQLRAAQIVECSARVILTVENLSSFNELVQLREPDVFILYTGGFASPTVIHLLKTLRAAYPQLSLSHWSDIDVGGLRILAHLRTNLQNVGTVGMEPSVLLAHRGYARALASDERTALQALTQSPLLRDCIPLIDAMLHENRKVEQEAISAATVMRALSTRT